MTTLKELEDGTYIVGGVLLGGCSLFKATSFEEGQIPKYNASFIFEPNDPTFLRLKAIVHEGVQKLNNQKAPPIYKSCIIDGDTRKADYYHGKQTISASSQFPTQVFDQAKHVINDDKAIFPGCTVNAIISFWEHSKMKTLFANLHGIQLVRTGDRLSGGGIDTTDMFEVLDDDDLIS